MRKKTKKIIIYFLILLGVILTVYFCVPKIAGPFLDWMDTVEANFANAVLFFTLIFISVNPFIPVRALLILGCSFVFKWVALAISYPSSVIAAWFWFWCFRVLSIRCKWNPDVVFHRFSTKWYMRFKALTNALDNQPVQTTTLLMLSSFPYGILVGLLATTNVTFKAIVIGSVVSNLKLIRDVWVETQAKNILDAWNGQSALSTSDSISLSISVTFSVIAFVAIAYYTNRELGKLEQHPEEVIRQQSLQEQAEEAEQETEQRASRGSRGSRGSRTAQPVATDSPGKGSLLLDEQVVSGNGNANASVATPEGIPLTGVLTAIPVDDTRRPGTEVLMAIPIDSPRRASDSIKRIQGVLVAMPPPGHARLSDPLPPSLSQSAIPSTSSEFSS